MTWLWVTGMVFSVSGCGQMCQAPCSRGRTCASPGPPSAALPLPKRPRSHRANPGAVAAPAPGGTCSATPGPPSPGPCPERCPTTWACSCPDPPHSPRGRAGPTPARSILSSHHPQPAQRPPVAHSPTTTPRQAPHRALTLSITREFFSRSHPLPARSPKPDAFSASPLVLVGRGDSGLLVTERLSPCGTTDSHSPGCD